LGFITTKDRMATMKAALLFVLLTPLAARADSPFDGTWVTQTDSFVFAKKADVYVLQKGVFQGKTFVPPIKVKADGTDQPVTGHAYFDTLTATVSSPGNVNLVFKKAGKTMFTNDCSVSGDGKTLSISYKDESGTQAITGTNSYTRVAAGPKGSDPISGSWVGAKVDSASANGLTVTFKATADGLTMNTPTGQSYDAKFDGKFVPVAGDPGQTMVALKKVNTQTIVETDKRMGRVTEVYTYTVAKDAASMHVTDDDKLHGTKSSWTNKKSP
jgi:hypothetical protein